MTAALVAYVPVLHEGYRRFLAAHGDGLPLHLIGPELHQDYRPLAKDIRALDPELTAQAIAAWGLCASVDVLDRAGAQRLAETQPSLTLPAEDVSYLVVERHFSRCDVRYAPAFLRWDKTRTAQLLVPEAEMLQSDDEQLAELVDAARAAAASSIDWWRQVGAAIRFADGEIAVAHNEHLPHPQSAYAVGDPRANFNKGVALELSTAVHAEARLIAAAAREGRATRAAVLFVSDFPCPPCSKLIAGAGIERLCFRSGYAVLDGQDVLAAAGVQILQVQ